MPRGYKRIDYTSIAARYPRVGRLTGDEPEGELAVEAFLADAVRAELHQLGLRLPEDSPRVARIRDAEPQDVLEVYRALLDEFLTTAQRSRALPNQGGAE